MTHCVFRSCIVSCSRSFTKHSAVDFLLCLSKFISFDELWTWMTGQKHLHRHFDLILVCYNDISSHCNACIQMCAYTYTHTHTHTHTPHTHTHALKLGHSLPEPQRVTNAEEKLPVEQLLVASCCYTLVNTIPPLPSSAQCGGDTVFSVRALWICFPQIVYWGPLGLSRDSRRTRCACLIKESDVYKCKHSILFSRCSPAASYLELAGRGLFLSLSFPQAI